MQTKKVAYAFLIGALVGSLGGLIGLGGAEFRLPLLILLFGFATRSAVIINKVVSLGVVVGALIFRSKVIGFDEILSHGSIIGNITLGSLIGAYFGADFVLKVPQKVLHRVVIGILLCLAMGMLFEDTHSSYESLVFEQQWVLYGLTFIAGLFIGAIAAILGVAGGEFIIPTLILLYGMDSKLAGSLSLCISLPTMVVAFGKYFKSEQFGVVLANKPFVFMMILGSFVGTFIGSYWLQFVHSDQIMGLMGIILLISALKLLKKEVWR